ncbi:MAG: chromate efflux transporter [Anaerolineales bacterium]
MPRHSNRGRKSQKVADVNVPSGNHGQLPTLAVPSLAELFGSFLRLGLTAFGGPAMVAYVRRMAVDQKHWLDEQDFRNGVALCQVIPGATVMQAAAYVGLRTRGLIGAALSFVGYALPAFVLMMILSALYSWAGALPAVVSIFSGLQAVIVAILLSGTVSFGRASMKDWRRVLLAVASASAFWMGVNPILVILSSALLGFAILESRPPGLQHPVETPRMRFPKLLLPLLALVGASFAALFLLRRPLFDLAALMFRVDLFAFGGGFASVPLMFHEVVQVRNWMDAATFLNGIVLGQVTPGPIVITATFVGYLRDGMVGALIATVSVFTPSFIILIGSIPYYDRLRSSPYFERVIGGIFASFVGLLLSTTLRFSSSVRWDVLHVLLGGAALAALLANVDILWVILIAATVSAIAFR